MVSIILAIGIGAIFIGWGVHASTREIVSVLRKIRNAIKEK